MPSELSRRWSFGQATKPPRLCVACLKALEPDFSLELMTSQIYPLDTLCRADLLEVTCSGLLRPQPTLLRKSADERISPFARQIYPTALVTGMPRAVVGFQGCAFLRGGMTAAAPRSVMALWHRRVSYAPSAVTLPIC